MKLTDTEAKAIADAVVKRLFLSQTKFLLLEDAKDHYLGKWNKAAARVAILAVIKELRAEK